MRNVLALAFGLVCIAAAFWLASGTSNQDDSSRPEIARAIATQLHSSPTPPPTDTPTPRPTATPAPTITPIADWTKMEGGAVQIWMPRAFVQMSAESNVAVLRYFSRAPVVGTSALYAYPSAYGVSAMPNLQIYRVETVRSPRRAPFGIDTADVILQKPKRISLGRYIALAATAEKILPSGSRFTERLYWIRQDEAIWLLLFTTHSENAARDLPVFENAARSFSILPAP